MAAYELVVITPLEGESLGQDGLTKLLETILKKVGGKVQFVEDLGERQLVYRIKGYERGHYLVYEVEAEKNKIKELNKQLKLQKAILRYLIIQKEVKK